jgi:hypothetical protein
MGGDLSGKASTVRKIISEATNKATMTTAGPYIEIGPPTEFESRKLFTANKRPALNMPLPVRLLKEKIRWFRRPRIRHGNEGSANAFLQRHDMGLIVGL